MAEPIKSPDGNFVWDGDKWLPISNNNQSLQMQDSVMSGDVVTNISHNSADSEVLRVALEGVGKLMQSSPQHQQPSPPQQQPSPPQQQPSPDEYLHTITLNSSKDGYKHEIIYSPLLSEKLRNVVDKMNQLAVGEKQFPSSVIDLQSFDLKTSNYLIEIWETLCKTRKDGKKKEMSDAILGLTIIFGIIGIIVYFFVL